MRYSVVPLVLGAILLSQGLASAQNKKKDVPVAAVPAVIVNAEKIFLSNGGTLYRTAISVAAVLD